MPKKIFNNGDIVFASNNKKEWIKGQYIRYDPDKNIYLINDDNKEILFFKYVKDFF